MDKRISIGDMIRQMREERGISQEELCEGICSQKMMSRYEAWETIPDRLSLNLMLQRMGKDAGKFVTILDKKEYDYLVWKKSVLESLMKEDKQAIARLLEDSMASDETKNANLQGQFYLYMQSYIADDCTGMKRALCMSLPSLENGIRRVSCIGTGELQMYLLYLEKCLETYGEGLEELRETLNYIETHFLEEEQVHVYPAAVRLYCRFGEVSGHDKIKYCKHAIRLLTEHMCINELPILLEILVESMEKEQSNELELYKKYVWSFREIYKVTNQEYARYGGLLTDMRQEIYTYGEVLKSYRIERGMSRETASEDICEVESYGRIERNARSVRTGNFKKMRERMGIVYDSYCAKIITNDYECLKMSADIEKLYKQHKGIQTEELLGELKKRLDLSSKINQQYICMLEHALKYCKKQYTIQDYKGAIRETIHMTIPGWNEDYEVHLYTATELQLLNHLLVCYIANKEYEKADAMMKKWWNCFGKNPHNLWMKSNEVLTLLGNWQSALIYADQYQEALQITNMALPLAIQSGRGDKLDVFFFELGWIPIQELGSSSEANEVDKMHCIQAYYISKLYCRTVNIQNIGNQLKESFNIQL